MSHHTPEKFYLTTAGLEKLKKEYKGLQKIRDAKITDQEELIRTNERIEALELIFKSYELIKVPPKNRQHIIYLGAIVTVELDGEFDEFTIVGFLETDPLNKKISSESPIGQSLIGRKVDETVLVKTPIVNHLCKIIKIKYN